MLGLSVSLRGNVVGGNVQVVLCRHVATPVLIPILKEPFVIETRFSFAVTAWLVKWQMPDFLG